MNSRPGIKVLSGLFFLAKKIDMTYFSTMALSSNDGSCVRNNSSLGWNMSFSSLSDSTVFFLALSSSDCSPCQAFLLFLFDKFLLFRIVDFCYLHNGRFSSRKQQLKNS